MCLRRVTTGAPRIVLHGCTRTFFVLLLFSICFSFALPLLFLCSSFALPLLFLCFSFAFPLLFPCYSFAIPLLFLCFSFAIPLLFLGFSFAIPWLFPRFPSPCPFQQKRGLCHLPLTRLGAPRALVPAGAVPPGAAALHHLRGLEAVLLHLPADRRWIEGSIAPKGGPEICPAPPKASAVCTGRRMTPMCLGLLERRTKSQKRKFATVPSANAL